MGKLSYLFLVCFALSCASKKDHQVTESKEAAVLASPMKGDLTFASDDSKRLGGLLQAKSEGKTPGLIECQREGSVTNCYLRGLMEDKTPTTDPMRLDEGLSGRVAAYFASSRPELREDPVVLGGLSCIMTGKTAPPYQDGTVCVLGAPHLASEAVLDDLIGAEVADTIQGQRPYDAGETLVLGTVLCQWGVRRQCVVRPIVDGALKETFIKLPNDVSTRLGDQLLLTLKISQTLDKTGAKSAKTPQEIMGNISCTVDSSAAAQAGRRSYRCIVRI